MSDAGGSHRLDRAVDPAHDHMLGPPRGDITLVEYGSYACPYCRAANEEIARLRDRFGDRMRYVFRQRPITGSDIARHAADIAESAPDEQAFWSAHVKLMTRSAMLTEDDLAVVASELGVIGDDATKAGHSRVDADVASSHASGVRVTPTFFINGRRYDGAWDVVSLSEAMLGSLGHRVHSAAVDFASWAPSAGVLLLVMSLVAVALVNSPVGPAFAAFWDMPFGLDFGGGAFRMSLTHWVNDALLTIFFLLVGLEIKREFTVGRLASRRSAAFPIAAALGGMMVPAGIYALILPSGPWGHGWGIPMATDTAFAVALIVMMGRRVPIELRVFLTAASIVDDIGSIVVVAFFYSGPPHGGYLAAAVGVVVLLALLNRWGVYRPMPYALLGIALWICVHASGLHATLAGVLLALFVPTRPPPNLAALVAQANAVLSAETARGQEVLRHGPSTPALRALDAIHDRLESPADRTLRAIEPWSSFVVLPIFALCNAGVALSSSVVAGHQPLFAAIAFGLVVGKPLGFVMLPALAVWAGIAVKPASYSWRQLLGAGALAGIGFTMSLFIASQAMPTAEDFSAAKIAVFVASIISAVIGAAILWKAQAGDGAEAVPDAGTSDGHTSVAEGEVIARRVNPST